MSEARAVRRIVLRAVVAIAAASGAAVAAETRAPVPSIEEMLAAVGETTGGAAGGESSAPAAWERAASSPEARPAADGPASSAESGPERLLAGFDELLSAHDYSGARKLVERASAKEGPEGAAALDAAARVARALEARRAAMRETLEIRTGTKFSLLTTAGRRKGEIRSVADAGVVLVSKTIINGRERGEREYAIAWADLAPAEEERLAKAWAPEETERAVALAALAFGRGELDAAEKTLFLAAEHPYAAHLRGRIAAIRRAAAEAAAGEAWKGLLRQARGKFDARGAERLGRLLDAFLKDHAATALVGAKAREIAALRSRLQLAAAPDFPTNYALAANGASGPRALIDGNSTEYTGGTGFASTVWKQDPPPSMLMTLKETLPLNVIRLLLWDRNRRFYRYRLEVSPQPSGERWVVVADYTGEDDERRSWQVVTFELQPVRRIRITGTYNSDNAGFHVVELEAYHAPVGFTPEQIVAGIEKAQPPRPRRGEGD